MRKLLLIFPAFLICLGILLAAEKPAYGYIDPGSGLLAIQALGSMLVAAGWYLRRKIYRLFHRGKAADTPAEPAEKGVPLP